MAPAGPPLFGDPIDPNEQYLEVPGAQSSMPSYWQQPVEPRSVRGTDVGRAPG